MSVRDRRSLHKALARKHTVLMGVPTTRNLTAVSTRQQVFSEVQSCTELC
jgi:hypothetical protein